VTAIPSGSVKRKKLPESIKEIGFQAAQEKHDLGLPLFHI